MGWTFRAASKWGFRLPTMVLVTTVCGADPVPEIHTLKRLYPRTVIVRDGRPTAVIVRPDGAEFETAAARLSDAIRERTGAALPVRRASELVAPDWNLIDDAFGSRNLIAIGNINTNRLLAVLYGEKYVVADSIYPYKGGYVIRTVHDPFARGVNVLVLAGSDPDGVRRAIDEFRERYVRPAERSLELPQPIVDVKFTPVELPFVPAPVPPEGAKRQPQYRTAAFYRKQVLDENGRVRRLEKGTVLDVLGPIINMAQSWFWTGDSDLPPLMKAFLDQNRRLLRNGLERVEMEGGTAEMLPWWDKIEELPVWTERDRLDITNAFLRDSRLGHERRAVHKLVKEGFVQVTDENHGTFSAWRDFLAWRYFDKYYRLPESEYWMTVARAIYAGQCASHQILEDSAGYMCYIPDTIIGYAFASRDLRYLTSGIARDLASYIAQAGVNNLGLSTGFGDSPGLVLPAAYQAILKAAWFYRDPELSWIVQRLLPGAAGLRAFQSALPYDLDIPLRKPAEWTGLRLFPIWRMPPTGRTPRKQPAYAPREPVGPEWFNKVVFREAWDPAAQYLLLDTAGKWLNRPGPYPLGPAGHKHDDVNTIVNFTDRGRMWLVDHTYSLRSIKDHSGLYILRDGQLSYRSHEARVEDHAQGETLAFCRSVFENFSGSDWERTIFWKRGRFFVVVDRVIAKEPGTFTIRCSFRGLGEARLAEGRLRLEQQGAYCDIVSDGEGLLDLDRHVYDNPSEWKRWYPYAEPVVKIFQQDKSRRLEAGGVIAFRNLLAAADSATDLDALEMISVSDSAVLVRDRRQDRNLGLFGVGDLPGDLAACSVSAATPDEGLFGGLTRLGPVDAPILQSDSPVTLYWNATGEAWVRAPRPTTLTVAGIGAPVHIAPEKKHRLELPRAQQAATFLAKAFSAARRLAEDYRGGEPGTQAEAIAPGTTRGNPPVRTAAVRLDNGVSDLRIADLDGDGRPEWVLAEDRGVAVRRSDGSLVWRFATPKPVRVLDATDLDGDGRPEIVAGCEGGNVVLLGPAGRLRWTFACKASQRKAGPPTPDMVRIADLDADGKPEVLIGANWVHCLDAEGRLNWEDYLIHARGRICGDFRCGALADFNGDGKQELLALFSYTYHAGMIFGPDGRVVFPPKRDRRKMTGLIKLPLPQCVAAVNLLGETGPPEFVLGSDQGLRLYWAAGPRAGRAGSGVGGDFRAMAVYRPEQGPPIVFGGTDMGAVVAVRGERGDGTPPLRLRVQWRAAVGQKIRALWAGTPGGTKHPVLLVGTTRGAVFAFDARSGKPLAGLPAVSGGTVVKFVPSNESVLVVHRDGLIAHYPGL
ncbi:MAG: hypothetical protein GXP31_08235 [Kiritimatiellaeota bacterium]|nr:hypothetical protein [Kiritimatiellota bacterium]